MTNMVLTLLTLMVLTACFNGRSDYSKQMNPVFQAHIDEYALAYDALDDMIACTPTPIDLMLDCGADYLLAVERYEKAASEHIDQWVLGLHPPDEALPFHELVLELFQLRQAAYYTTRVQFEEFMRNPSIATDAAYIAQLERAAGQFDRADRLLIRIYAEARKLGDVNIIED